MTMSYRSTRVLSTFVPQGYHTLLYYWNVYGMHVCSRQVNINIGMGIETEEVEGLAIPSEKRLRNERLYVNRTLLLVFYLVCSRFKPVSHTAV